MGAQEFIIKATGRTADEAFRKAIDEARYMSGHGGYSGTIGEKSDFTMIEVEARTDRKKIAFAQKLLEDQDPRIDDKWGPAGCIKLKAKDYLFFGWASS